jgi:hypothetical protein
MAIRELGRHGQAVLLKGRFGLVSDSFKHFPRWTYHASVAGASKKQLNPSFVAMRETFHRFAIAILALSL